jgi:Protein of unknown function (DUF3822)
MAQKKIGIYGVQESTANNKVEDLYLVVDEQSICFVVKNHTNGQIISFEYFENNPDQNGWNQLLGYLQNNSKLIQSFYRQVQFVMNTKKSLLTKSVKNGADVFYQNEFKLIYGLELEEEVQTQSIEHGQVIVYSVPDALSTLLTRAFPTGKWTNYIGNLIQSIQEDGVYISLFDTYFIVLILQDGKTHFINYFLKGGADQNNYQVLNACAQSNTEPNTCNLHVTGYNAERDHWIQALSSYFSNAHMQHAPETGIGATLNNEYPNHSYAPYFIF